MKLPAGLITDGMKSTELYLAIGAVVTVVKGIDGVSPDAQAYVVGGVAAAYVLGRGLAKALKAVAPALEKWLAK